MRVEILQPIVGLGDAVEGFRHEYALEVGMIADVENEQALAWISSGICRSLEPEPEAATVATPETATRKRPGARPRKGSR